MKFKGLSGLIVLAFCLSLLALFVCAEQAKEPSPEARALMKKMVFREKMPKNPEMMLSLADQIISDNTTLAEKFKNRDFIAMAKLLGERAAVLVTPGYDKILGKYSAEFWQSAWKEGVDLEIRVSSIFLNDALGTQEVPVCKCCPEGKTTSYNAIANVSFEFHLVQKEKGAIVHNQTGGGGSTYMHQTQCPWI